MNLLKLLHLFFLKWVTSVYKSNYFEILVALEAPSSSLHAKQVETNKDIKPCKG